MPKLSKKQGIRLGQSKQETTSDFDDRFRVIRILYSVYGIPAIFDRAISIPRTGWYRDPDVWIPLRNTAIDLHGEAHPGDREIMSRKDLDRIDDYASARVKYIIIWKSRSGGYSQEGIMEELDKHFKRTEGSEGMRGGRAQRCANPECDHTKSDHKQNPKTELHELECEWYDCDCKQYEPSANTLS